MKHLFFVVLLANIVFFLWEFNFGSWRQLNAEKPSSAFNANKILLLSEVAEDQQKKTLAGEQVEVVALLTEENKIYPQEKNNQESNELTQQKINSIEKVAMNVQKLGGDTGAKPKNLQIETTHPRPPEIQNSKIEGEELADVDGEQAEILLNKDAKQKIQNDEAATTEIIEPVLTTTDVTEKRGEKNDVGKSVEKPNPIDTVDKTSQHESSLDKLTVQTQSYATVILTEEETVSSQNGSASPKNLTPVEFETVLGCYDIGPFVDEESRQRWLDSLAVKTAFFSFFSKENSISNGFLVYYPAADTFAESKAIFEMLQGQGITDIWLFRKGEVRGDISLGVYTKESRALRLQKAYADQGMMLKIKPRFKTKTQFFLRLSWDKQKLNALSQSVDSIVETIPELTIKATDLCDF